MPADIDSLHTRAEILTEALPYIREFAGQTIVVKYGGHAMADAALKRDVMSDLILMKCVGMKPVLVHGGGPQISALMKRVGKKAEFVNGLRVSDQETVALAEMALVGQVNRDIVGTLNQLGASAVGLSGKDAMLIQARKHYAIVKNGDDEESSVDLGFVGEITHVNPHIIRVLESEGFIPVVAGTGVGEAGETYNINADAVAGEIAAALGASKLILLSDIRGVLRDKDDPDSLISTIHAGEIERLRDEGVFSAGMIPKIEACVTALEGGVHKAHIIDGRISHSLLHEVFSDDGIGTQLTKEGAQDAPPNAP